MRVVLLFLLLQLLAFVTGDSIDAEVVDGPQPTVFWKLKVELKVDFKRGKVIASFKREADGKLVQTMKSPLKR